MILPRIGLGCMSLSHAYGVPPSEEDGLAFLRSALDEGMHACSTPPRSTAAVAMRSWLGAAIAGRRDEVVAGE